MAKVKWLVIGACVFANLLSGETTPELDPDGSPLGQIEAEETQVNKVWIPKLDLKVDVDSIRNQVRRKLIESLKPRLAWTVPGSSIITPTAYGAQWTELFVGLGVESRARFNTLPNSTAHAGFGIGSAEFVALETAFTSYGTIRRGPPFTIGGVSFKLHRFFPSVGLAAAVGYENAIVWGVPDSGQSYYGVVSKHFIVSDNANQLFSLVTVHLGVGDGRFRTENDVRDEKMSFNLFGAVGVRIFEPMSLILNWSGSDLSAGLSFAPFQTFPLVITVTSVDLAGVAGDGPRHMLLLSFGDSWK